MTKQIFLFTGARGVGKSTAMATYVKPSDYGKLLVMDTENSWSNILPLLKDQRIKPGEYVQAYERFRLSDDLLNQIARGQLPWVSERQKSALLGYYDWVVHTLDEKLVQGKFKYVIIDTIEPIEAALTAWAEVNRKQSGWSGSYAYGGLEVEAIRPLYENLLEAISRRGVETIMVSSHLRQPWIDKKPVPNKVEPGGRLKLLSRISSMMLWLVQDNTNKDGAPAALVLKARLGLLTVENDSWKPQQVLPERIPHFSWENVEDYKKHPAHRNNPQPGETMTVAEREMISDMLNDEQMKLMVLGAESEREQVQLMTPFIPPSDSNMNHHDKILEMHNGGATSQFIAEKLGLSLPRVIKIVRETR